MACLDFIGNLLKFNKRAVTIFELTVGETIIDRLIYLVHQNYVNSNLFIRDITLSMMKFE